MLVGLHYTAFRDAIREDSRQTTPSRGVTPRKKFDVEANVESRVNNATVGLVAHEDFVNRPSVARNLDADDLPADRIGESARACEFLKARLVIVGVDVEDGNRLFAHDIGDYSKDVAGTDENKCAKVSILTKVLCYTIRQRVGTVRTRTEEAQ